MKIVILTDSFGGHRPQHTVQKVLPEETYPELLKKRLAGHEVVVHYEGFRKLTHFPSLLQQYKNADVYILQAGIVDLYPRPLTYKNTIGQAFFVKLLRRIVRLNRRFVVKYLYNKPWSTETEVREAVSEVCKNNKSKIFWINVSPVNRFQDWETPGANAAIRRTNSILHEVIKNYPHCTEIDMHKKLIELSDYEEYIHPKDSHLNVQGNELYAAEILKALHTIPSLKEG